MLELKKKVQFAQNLDYLKEYLFMNANNVDELLSDDIFKEVTADFEQELSF